jgi:hypothetical protein
VTKPYAKGVLDRCPPRRMERSGTQGNRTSGRKLSEGAKEPRFPSQTMGYGNAVFFVELPAWF